MRQSITTLLAIVVLALAGCGQQLQTRSEYERAHEYADIEMEIPAQRDGDVTVVRYVDLVPNHVAFDYDVFATIPPTTYTRVTTTNAYDAAGKIVAQEVIRGGR